MFDKIPLTDDDKETLFAIANSRMRLSDAARAMYMHRNAVTYRAEKIQERTGLDPMNFWDLCELLGMIERISCENCRHKNKCLKLIEFAERRKPHEHNYLEYCSMAEREGEDEQSVLRMSKIRL